MTDSYSRNTGLALNANLTLMLRRGAHTRVCVLLVLTLRGTYVRVRVLLMLLLTLKKDKILIGPNNV